MPAVARSSGTDSVFSPDGTGWKCKFPMTTSTGAPSQQKVSAMGTLVVVAGDPVAMHMKGGCVPDMSSLDSYSSRVSAVGGKVGRIGDTYGDNTIISGASRVFCG
jgi:uncharacterized Zn-binding protein involved in type VI secretion